MEPKLAHARANEHPRHRRTTTEFLWPLLAGILLAAIAPCIGARPTLAAQCLGNTTIDFNDGQIDYRLYTAKDAACASMTATATSGQLAISRPAGIGTNCSMSANLVNGYEVCGDFDIQVDFNLLNFPAPSSGRARYATLYVWDQCGGDYVGIERFLASGAGGCLPYANSYKIWKNTTNECGSSFVATNHTLGKFRVARTATVWSLYYWNGASWSLGQTYTGSTGPVGFSVYTGGNSPEAQEVRFDNIVIQSSSALVCAPTPGPCLTTLQDDFSDGVLHSRWSPSPGCTSLPVETGGELVLTGATCSGSSAVTMDGSQGVLCGDFDVSVDFRLQGFGTPSAGSRWASMALFTPGGATLGVIERYARFAPGDCTPSTQNYKAFTSSSLNCNSIIGATTDMEGKLRIARVGCLVTFYHYSSTGWVPLLVRRAHREPVALQFYTGSDAANSLHTAYFDNLWATSTPPSSCAPQPPVACVQPPSGMVAWWPGDQDGRDIMGSYEGTLTGAGIGAGRVGQGFLLDGGGYVGLPNLAATQGAAFTVDAWFKTTATAQQIDAIGQAMTVYSEGNSASLNPVFQLYMNSSGSVRFFQRDNSGVVASGGSLAGFNDGQWHHAAVVKDSPNSRKIYLDGVLVGSSTATLGASSYDNGRIGGLQLAGHGPQQFIGAIDEVEVFSRALSASEIQSIVGAGGAGKCKDLAPPSVTAPPDVAYQCASEVPEVATDLATATDDVGVLSFTVAESSNGGAGSPSSPLVIIRTWTATDEAGHIASASQTITVVDDTAPTLTLPADIAASTGPGTAPCAEVRLEIEVGTATASDNCGEPTVTVSGRPEGDAFPVGESLLTWTATDAAGNSTSGTQRVVVTCPVGDLVGSAALVCGGQSQPASGVTVHLLHEGSPFLSTPTGPAGDYRFEQIRQGTYIVSIEAPSGYAVAPSTQLVSLDQGEVSADPFSFTCLLSDLAGEVLGTCNGATTGLQGVTVDAYRVDDSMDVLVATTATDASGHFQFDDLALGTYTLGVVLPLGYTTNLASQDVTLDVPDGSEIAPSFSLTCQPIAAQPRSMGYWKHQVNVYLTGKGNAQETLADLLHFIDELVVHFNENLVNPVVVYVPGAMATNDKLLQLQQLLTVNRGGTGLDRAKQQLLALLLNVVSGKISQTEAISSDGSTVSQAITHSHDLIVDGNPTNDETAKTICDLINNGQQVPVGMVPVETRVIAYEQKPEERPEVAFGIHSLPNPVRSSFSAMVVLAGVESARLELIDITGRRVWRGDVTGSGRQLVRVGDGAALASGVYRLRLVQGGQVATRTVVVTR